MNRPEPNKEISLKDFNDFYWLKEELVGFCKTVGITTSGGKVEVAERIRDYIAKGVAIKKGKKSFKAKSTFNWDNEKLTPETVIIDNYRNGENVRGFFTREIGLFFLSTLFL